MRRTHPRLARIVDRLWLWQERRRTRHDLLTLGDADLKDIGLSRVDAWREGYKPFWRE